MREENDIQISLVAFHATQLASLSERDYVAFYATQLASLFEKDYGAYYATQLLLISRGAMRHFMPQT